MRVKIIKARSSSYWYANEVGNVFEVKDYDSTNYSVITRSGCILKADCVEVERTYEHEGKVYSLPDWANYVTKDGDVDDRLFAWELEPKAFFYTIKKDSAGFGHRSGQRRELELYVPPVKPLPKGAFVKKVGA